MSFLHAIMDIQSVLKLWRMQNLTLEGRIFILKILVWSKIVYLALLINFPDYTIKETQEYFVWKHSSPKIQHKNLRMDYKNGQLKNVDIFLKMASLQCSWVKKLFVVRCAI